MQWIPEEKGVIDKTAAKRIATLLEWQPKREWVGLTEEDIDDAEIHLTSCRNNHESWIEGIQEFAQAIEAKLREKNRG